MRFGQYFKKSRNGFPIVFSKYDLAGGEGAFLINKQENLKKQNTPKYTQDLVVTWAKPNPITPPSSLMQR